MLAKAAEAELVALGAALRGGLLAQRIASVDNALLYKEEAALPPPKGGHRDCRD